MSERRRHYLVRSEAANRSEHRLMMAVLDEAISCFQKHLLARDKRGRQLFREAEEWIMSEDTDQLFSFENLCHMVGLDSAYLQRGLRRWRERELARHSSSADSQAVTASLSEAMGDRPAVSDIQRPSDD